MTTIEICDIRKTFRFMFTNMKCSIIIFCVLWNGAFAFCPSLCTCKSNKAPEGLFTEPRFGDQVKMKCGGTPTQITELKEINFMDLTNYVISLNLSYNAISTLSRELRLPNLQKLDLSRNQINLIETDAFYNTLNLQRLDLSYNQISHIGKDVFKGLTGLEKLIISHNHLSKISVGTFDYLVGLKQLDITDNPLMCDCEMLWLGDWSRNTSVKLVGSPKCAYPENMVNKTVRKLKIFLDLAACADVLPSNTLIVEPSVDQIVFVGDSLTLSCNAPFASLTNKYELKWLHPTTEDCEFNITSTEMQEDGLAETTVFMANITEHHMGNWTCVYNDQSRLKHNHTLQILVISNSTKYCQTNHISTNKGLFSWPQLLVNHTAKVPCSIGKGYAYRDCLSNSTWGSVNATECMYISNVTKLLQQFSLLNLSLVQFSAANATRRLASLIREKTYPLAEIADADDVMFIARAVKNYMQYMREDEDLGSSLLDVISASMNISKAVLSSAETMYGACTELLLAAEEIAMHINYTNNTNNQKRNMAVFGYGVGEAFAGATCVWYSAARGGPPALHCSTANRTAAPLLTVSDALIHASVQIPQTVLYSTTSTGQLQQSTSRELVVSVYEDASLLPSLPRVVDDGTMRVHRTKDYYGQSTKREDINMEITSPVIGFQLRGEQMQGELVEPIIATVRGAVGGAGAGGRAAVWRPHAPHWLDNTTDCRITHIISEMIIMSCTKLAYIGLLQNVETGIYGARTDGARFKLSHPAIYVGSLVLIGCLSCAAFTYIMCFPAVQMAKKSKHALVNTWIAIGLLCFMYTFGIYQTEDVKLCQILGLLIHYLTLSCLLWMCVSASSMYKWVTRTQASAQSPEDMPDITVQKPIMGIYLVGWGIASIVCGISGAVNLKDYAGYAQCFLSTAPALSALFIPGGILLTVLLIMFLLIRCTVRNMNVQLSEGTQATENVDLEMWEPALANDRAERRSIKSGVDSEVEDVEHTPIVQLRGQIIVLCLYLSVWTCGAIAVYRPLPAYLPYQEDICSIVYAVCATVLGTFILFFYGIARSDVREQWAMMSCSQKSNKCCRNRSVFDANQRAPAPAAVQIPNDNRSRSDSRSSNRTNSKTNNSAAYKAAAELNSQTLRDKNTNKKTPNINLVVLHRQQYRSNNSMVSGQYTDTANVGAEVFYNPNQMNVAKKFFKKQKQNMKRNCLELPQRRDFDEESNISSREPHDGVASIINAGSKVNNTNIHVDKSSNGIKEARNVQNPNLMEDDQKDYKSYSTDRKSWKSDDAKSNRAQIMNIYTNVPETRVPQHQIVKSETQKSINCKSSASEECLQSQSEHPDMVTVSQQCSLEYSSASEVAMANTCSDHTLNTHSEITSLHETQSALCSTNEITDTESFGQYIDYLHTKEKDTLDKSLQDISEEGALNSYELDKSDATDKHDAIIDQSSQIKGSDDKIEYPISRVGYDLETCSVNTSEQGFENESDIYCPNYQMSEVSIRSHGLYAPSPSSMCPNEICFSNEDISILESQYVNYDPGWRSTLKSNPKLGKYVPTPTLSCPNVNRESPVSFSSDLDELYTRITNRGKERLVKNDRTLDVTVNSDVTLKPTDSDSCMSEANSDIIISSETIV